MKVEPEVCVLEPLPLLPMLELPPLPVLLPLDDELEDDEPEDEAPGDEELLALVMTTPIVAQFSPKTVKNVYQ